MFNMGALVGAVGSGILVKHVPYWHLVLVILALHIIGYVLYAISYDGWVMMVSKFLSGTFIGGEMTLALSYFAESSLQYEEILLQLDKKVIKGNIRRRLFALHNVGVGLGYILGPGMQVCACVCLHVRDITSSNASKVIVLPKLTAGVARQLHTALKTMYYCVHMCSTIATPIEPVQRAKSVFEKKLESYGITTARPCSTLVGYG